MAHQQEMEIDNIDRLYEVEAICGKRIRKGEVQYQIKWHGWLKSANTWEPLVNLQACSLAVDAYERLIGGKAYSLKYMAIFQQTAAPVEDPRQAVPVVDNQPPVEEAVEAMEEAVEAMEEEDNDLFLTLSELKDSAPRKRQKTMPEKSSPTLLLLPPPSGPLTGAKKRKAGTVMRFERDEEYVYDHSGDFSAIKDGLWDPPYIQNDSRSPIVEIVKPLNDGEGDPIIFTVKRANGVVLTAQEEYLRCIYPDLLKKYYDKNSK